MKPGIYIGGKSITKVLGIQITHQFIVLVPHKASTLAGKTRLHKGVRYFLIGAYGDSSKKDPRGVNYLRAQPFAPSDVKPFEIYLDSEGKTGAQVEPAEVQSCFIDMDHPIESTYRAYTLYKQWEGKPGELIYPPGPQEQLSKEYYNSNSWAQSCVTWGCLEYTKKVSDFRGIDPGHDRRIPQKYFLNAGWLYR